MAAGQAPLEPGIYTVDKEAVGSLAPKFRGMSYAFMVTNAIGEGSDIQMWCADLVMAGKVPSGQEYAGLDVWALHGHPFNNVFVVVDDALVECDSEWNRRYVWKRSHDLHGKLFREAATPPILAKSFPSDNFIEAVIHKNPNLNEPYSPSTQTIVEACAYFSQPLSDDARERQEQLVRLYTAETPLYHEMNQALRDDAIDKMRYFGAYIKELRDVFKTDHEDQIITPFEGTVWRGIKFPNASEAIKQYKPGSIFVWPAFTSMSTAKNAAMGFGNLVFEITCFPPPGHYDDDSPEYAPASVEEWSCYKSEHEILFPPNVKFKVQEIKEPDGVNGLVSPLVVCETVGFDTDGGIIEFSKMQEEATQRRARESIEEQVAAQQGQLDEVHSKLDECCDRVNDCCQRVDDCFQRLEEMTQHLDRCFGRLDRCENSAALGVQGLQELRSRLSGGLGAPQEELKSLQQQLKSCATESDLTKLRERLEGETAARVKADEARQREEQRLGARCDDLQAKVLELATAQSQERGTVQQRFEHFQVEQKQGRSSMEQELAKLSQKMQAMLAESIAREKGIEREVSKLSQKMQDQHSTDVRRTQEMDQVLKGLTDKCYMTNMILATEKLKHETLEIKSLLSTEQKRSHSSVSKRAPPAPPGNARATLDAAVQGVSDIKTALENLRFQLPKDMQVSGGMMSFLPSADLGAEQPLASRGVETPAGTPRQGEHMAVGGALQAARAARRPSVGGLPADDG